MLSPPDPPSLFEHVGSVGTYHLGRHEEQKGVFDTQAADIEMTS